MARPKKTEDKPKEGATLNIDVDSFVRTRNDVVAGLATLQDVIQNLSNAYINHTNAVLSEHGEALTINAALAPLANNTLLSGLNSNLARGSSPSAKSNVEAAGSDKKERKKRQHDPNAPKRPLTPFFLYMQTARPIIANDLGADVAKGAVSTEGTRRWSTMDAGDKQLWTNAYKDNLRLYNARMHAYKVEKNLQAKDMTDIEAMEYAEAHNIGADATADAQLVGEASAGALVDEDAEGEPEPEPEKEPTPPPKATPKAKAGRKAKAPKSTPAASVPETITPPTPIVPAKEPEKEKSPDKKRKRASKKVDEVVEPEEAPVETPKSGAKPRKKKTKSDA